VTSLSPSSGTGLTQVMAAEADCVLIATDHTAADYAAVQERAKLVVDAIFKNQVPGKTVRL
jgi:UDP-N-acetyl-D-mannosaminuronate dehydrogenase